MIRLHLTALSAGDPAVLSDEERSRADRFRHRDAQRRYVAGRTWLRRVLARELGCAAAEVDLRTDQRSKPVVPGGPWFNLSRSGDIAVVAVADRPVGVDVEAVDPHRWDRRAAGLVLSADELSHVDGADPLRRDLAFFRCWTRKEAWAKRDGAGLTDGLRALTLLTDRVPGADVRLRTLEWVDPALVVSVAATGDWDLSVEGSPAQPARPRSD